MRQREPNVNSNLLENNCKSMHNLNIVYHNNWNNYKITVCLQLSITGRQLQTQERVTRMC